MNLSYWLPVVLVGIFGVLFVKANMDYYSKENRKSRKKMSEEDVSKEREKNDYYYIGD